MLGHALVRLLELLTRLLALHCLLYSRAPLRSFARSLARSLVLSSSESSFVYEMNASISYKFIPPCTAPSPSASPPPLPLPGRHHCTHGRNGMKLTQSAGPFAHPLARSLALLTHLLALHASLARFAALIRSLTRSGAHGKEIYVHEMNASISYIFNPLCVELKKVKKRVKE